MLQRRTEVKEVTFLSGNGRKQVVVMIFNETMNAVSLAFTISGFSQRIKCMETIHGASASPSSLIIKNYLRSH